MDGSRQIWWGGIGGAHRALVMVEGATLLKKCVTNTGNYTSRTLVCSFAWEFHNHVTISLYNCRSQSRYFFLGGGQSEPQRHWTGYGGTGASTVGFQKCNFKHFLVKFCRIPKIIKYIKDMIFPQTFLLGIKWIWKVTLENWRGLCHLISPLWCWGEKTLNLILIGNSGDTISRILTIALILITYRISLRRNIHATVW